MSFRDRSEAGRRLAERLSRYAGRPEVIVLALPRGGVPVAAEVARELGVPLDVYVVRKLGAPGRRELAMGAIASGGVRVLNDPVLRSLSITPDELELVTREEAEELERRERALRGDRPPPELAGRTAILVDDGIATGSTMRAAIAALRELGAGRIVIGVPVASPDTCAELEREVDDLVCVETPDPFYAISLWYADFRQLSDDEVRAILARAQPAEREAGSAEAGARGSEPGGRRASDARGSPPEAPGGRT